MNEKNNCSFKVTAIVSVYKAEKFIRNCIEDLVCQTLYKKGQLEIVIINSNSPESEEEIIKDYESKYDNIVYLKTERREPIYKAWNRGVKLATGKYLTNANVDDCHREDALEIMANELDENENISLVYADIFLTKIANQKFVDAEVYDETKRPNFSEEILYDGCRIGPQPMWRKSLHDQVGYFNESFFSAGDYEFWSRLVFKYGKRFKHINQTLGLYLYNESGIELGNWSVSQKESALVVNSYKKYRIKKSMISNATNNPIDIIFLTYNRLKYFHETIEKLINNTRYNYNIIIVDNNSDKEFTKYLQQTSILYHKLILNDKNEWTAAFQKGIDNSSSDPFIVSDPDILVPALEEKCWLERLINLNEQNEEIGLLALNLDPTNKPAQMSDVYIGEKQYFNDEITLGNVGTVMQAIKRKYFNFNYTTDWETCEGIRRNGGKVGFARNIVGYHLGWNEEEDYPDYMVDKFKYFNETYGVDTYKLYTEKEEIISAMDNSVGNYYEYSRPEVQELVNPEARKILDVGCGSGVMAFELKEKLNAEVWGIELFEKAAQKARTKLDKVIVGSVENAINELPEKYFDTITFADILEHLVDPGKIINKIKSKLKPNGEIIASLPNIRHWTVIKKLIEGNWRYEEAGLLDKTHLRFFTFETAIELFNKCGFNIRDIKATVSEKYEFPIELLDVLRKYGYNVSTLQEHSQYYQYLIKADFNKKGITTSIVIPVYNQLENTIIAIDSIYENTNSNFEIIVVDNNSKQEVVDYLSKLKDVKNNIKIIRNDKNLGFPAAVNQGLIHAEGKYVVIANNDIIVNNGWLDKFIEIAESNDSIGIVSGISNEVSGVQKDHEASYQSIEEMKNYAKMIKLNNKDKILEFSRVAFLCTLIKKELITKIGGLDERFSPGNYEDDDFCLRSQVAGYKTVICKDVFIHHFGSKSFKANGNEKYDSLLNTNRKKFIDKWGNDPDSIWLKGKNVNLREVEYPIDKNEIHKFVKRANYNIHNNEYELGLANLKQCILFFKNEDKIEEGELKLSAVLNLTGKVLLKLEKEKEAEYYFSMAKKIENNIFKNDDCIIKLDELENELTKENTINNAIEKKTKIVNLP